MEFANTSLIKIKWSRRMLVEALEEVRAFNRYMDGEPNDKFGDLASKVDLKMRARFLRIQGMIELQFNNNEHLEEARESFKRSIEQSEDDYRAWSGLAYSCTRMITAKGQFVSDAIRAFLKATALNPRGSLEYLCRRRGWYVRRGALATSESGTVSCASQVFCFFTSTCFTWVAAAGRLSCSS